MRFAESAGQKHDARPRPIVFADARSPVHRGRDVGEPEGRNGEQELFLASLRASCRSLDRKCVLAALAQTFLERMRKK